MDLSDTDVGLRLSAAALAGGIIGINRDLPTGPSARGRWGCRAWRCRRRGRNNPGRRHRRESERDEPRGPGRHPGRDGRDQLHWRGRDPTGCAGATVQGLTRPPWSGSPLRLASPAGLADGTSWLLGRRSPYCCSWPLHGPRNGCGSNFDDNDGERLWRRPPLARKL